LKFILKREFANEKYISMDTQKRQSTNQTNELKWLTISPKDKLFRRTWVWFSSGTNLV